MRQAAAQGTRSDKSWGGRRLIRTTALVSAGAAISFVLSAFGLGPARAQASTYTAYQCAPGAGFIATDAFPFTQTAVSGYLLGDDCWGAGKTILSEVNTALGDYAEWWWYAPSGTHFSWFNVDARIVDGGGHIGRIFFRRATDNMLVNVHTGSTGGGYMWIRSEPLLGPQQMSGAGVQMWCSTIDCLRTGEGLRARNFAFGITDTSPPVLTSSSVPGGWVNGSQQFSATATDTGAGMDKLALSVNGQQVREDDYCSPQTFQGAVHSTTPCPNSRSASWSVDVGQAPFAEGANTVTLRATEFGDGPASATESRTVYVDRNAPAAPYSPSLEGGSDWQGTNEFDLSWSNPGQDYAPIDGAYYRIEDAAGNVVEGPTFVAGSNLQRLENIDVPGSGQYTVRVWLRDQAGNASSANSATATLRYDGTVPPKAEAEFNGWVRRNDFPYTVRWTPVEPADIGPSGLRGYAVLVDGSPTTDPCNTDGNPACSDAEVTKNGGRSDNTVVLSDYPEGGDHYVHVAAVTGSGLKAAEIGHTRMPVDKTDPQSAISGAPEGWVDRDVTVTANASDPGSGMVPNPTQFPNDPQPRAVIKVDEAETAQEGDSVSRTVSDEGNHTVSYWARDLAGNENDGRPNDPPHGKQNNSPSTVQVKIDKSDPTVQASGVSGAWTNQTVTVRASATDALSGMEASADADGEQPHTVVEVDGVEYRRTGPEASASISAEGEHPVRWYAQDLAGNSTSDAPGSGQVRIDKTVPQVSLSGAPQGWTNQPATISARSADALSGIVYTALWVDGSEQRAGADLVSATIADDGVHAVRYVAEDAAGNATAVGEGTVKVDRTAPSVRLADQDPEDPGLLRASVSDATSGVASGTVFVRREGASGWQALETRLAGGYLEARVPETLSRGHYEVRAEARDAAGNVGDSRSRPNGALMTVDVPVRTDTRIVAAFSSQRQPDSRQSDTAASGSQGGREMTIGYGETVTVTGALRAADGTPLLGKELRVTETYADGSSEPRATYMVSTGKDGAFSVALPAGPSREVGVEIAGTSRYAGASERGLKLEVRSKVLGFRAPRKVRERRSIAFSGRVGMLGVDMGQVGKLVELQYQKSKHSWNTIETARTGDGGIFSLAYGLRNNYDRAVKVRFRVVVPPEGNWPYAGTARSQKRWVTIEPR